MTDNGSDSLPFEPPEQENIRLREENARLRRLLAVHSISIPQRPAANPPQAKTVEPPPPVDKEERARQRVALFRSLFRGREDVYARRWENADGRHGYMPAVVKDWKAINKSQLCGTNSFDYLIELQRHIAELSAQPSNWMPWNYRDRLRSGAERPAV